jgi:hypothetical protein
MIQEAGEPDGWKTTTYQTSLGCFDRAITKAASRLSGSSTGSERPFQTFATKLGDTSAPQLEAIVTRYSLDELRQRYVIEGRPLEASLEEILRADTRAGARAILASIEKRRFENRYEG